MSGFIVLIEGVGVGQLQREPFEEGDNLWPRAGILMDGEEASVFPSNYRAEEAIKRTVNYGQARHQREWPERDAYRIVPLTLC